MTNPANIKPKLHGVLFDFDGLIIDTETTRFQAWSSELAHLGIKIDITKYVCLTHLRPKRSNNLLASALLPAVEHDPATICTLVDNVNAENMRLANRLQPLPGVRSLLHASRSAGLRTAVVSGSRRDWIEHHLHRLGLADSFTIIVAEGNTTHGKPHPAPYLRALRELRLSTQQIIALEDSPIGVFSANRAGLVCLAIPNQITADLLRDHNGPIVPSLNTITLNTLTDIVHQHTHNQRYPLPEGSVRGDCDITGWDRLTRIRDRITKTKFQPHDPAA